MGPAHTRFPGLPDPELQPAFYSAIVAKRLLAGVVDLVIIALLVLVALGMTLFLTVAILPLVWLTVEAMYRIVMLANHSATLGQRLMAIEMRDRYGRRLDRPTATWQVLGHLGATVLVVPQLVSLVMMLTSPRRQGLVDSWLGTAAINRPTAG